MTRRSTAASPQARGTLDPVAWLLVALVVLGVAAGRAVVGAEVYGVNPVWASVGAGCAAIVVSSGWWRVALAVLVPAYVTLSAVLVGSPVFEAVMVGLAGGVAALGGAYVLVRTGTDTIDSPRAFQWLALTAAVAGGAIASVGMLVALANDIDPRFAVVAGVANASAILVWCPVLLRRSTRAYEPLPPLETGLQLLVLSASTAVAVAVGGFGTAIASAVVLLTLSWAGLRFGLRVTSLQLVALSLVGTAVWLVGSPLHSLNIGISDTLLLDVERSWSIGVFVALAAVWTLPLALIGDRRRDVEMAMDHQRHALDATRSRFVTTTSHELRTPLTNILGRLDLLREGEAGPLNPAQQHLVDTVAENAGRLTDLVESIVILNRLDDPSTQARVHLRLDEVVRDAVARERASRPDSPDSPVAVRLDLDEAGTVADERTLHTAVRHLVRNALTFARTEVVVSVSDDGDLTALTVENDGRPISPDERDQIFDPFFRGERAEQQATPGCGIGLTIVQVVTERHGGELSVSSTEGRTRFRLELPALPGPGGQDARRGNRGPAPTPTPEAPWTGRSRPTSSTSPSRSR
ncbi:HAMP domain-containing sensor histidine kinase [Nocardioides zeae]|uniref:Sensor-like histidine kinase SenX3 n=1 Tax=Nocardioides imazamoxiresistens TaxID=3231893 RepID=A0ABU3PTU0_9ACTN|nr:HAMP domain-containing sensor histidine kinase [Nocardioides zeae]MDT9592657.1 HAMP domain-containing sensor histidine kinase [Nocardioides zeae]